MLDIEIIIQRIVDGATDFVILVDGDRSLCLSSWIIYGQSPEYSLGRTIGEDYETLITTKYINLLREKLEDELKGYNYSIEVKPTWLLVYSSSAEEFETEEQARARLHEIHKTGCLWTIKLIKSDQTNTWMC